MFSEKFLSVLGENYSFLLQGMSVSLQITLIAIIVGIIWGTFLTVLRLYAPKPIAFLAAGYVNLFRAIPLIMVLMWFYIAIGPSIEKLLGIHNIPNIRLFWAIIAFSLFEAAYYSEIMRAGFSSVKREQYNAARALGMSKIQSIYYIILPQAFRNMAPLLLTQAIILFQDTSLVYIMSLNDFFRTTTIVGYNNSLRQEFIIFAGLIYFIICFTLSLGVRYFQSNNAAKDA